MRIWIAFRMTLVLTLLTGIIYPVAMVGLAHLVFPSQAEGSLIVRNGRVIGSTLIGQNFSLPGYFHGRASASGSGLDADISPAGAELHAPPVAKARGLSEDSVRSLVSEHTRSRWPGILGEPRVNVLELNLALDDLSAAHHVSMK